MASGAKPGLLGALPTTFVPPPACTSSFDHLYQKSRVGALVYGPISTDGCFPSNYKPERASYFSPATACPAGYTTAFSAGAVETTVLCCPSGGGFTLDNGHTALDYEKTLACYSKFDTISTTVIIIDEVGVTRTTQELIVTSPRGAVNAYGYQLRFQVTDSPTSLTLSPLLGLHGTRSHEPC